MQYFLQGGSLDTPCDELFRWTGLRSRDESDVQVARTGRKHATRFEVRRRDLRGRKDVALPRVPAAVRM